MVEGEWVREREMLCKIKRFIVNIEKENEPKNSFLYDVQGRGRQRKKESGR